MKKTVYFVSVKIEAAIETTPEALVGYLQGRISKEADAPEVDAGLKCDVGKSVLVQWEGA